MTGSVGVGGETVAGVKKLIKHENHRVVVERIFAALLLLGLAGELTGLIHASRLTGQIIDSANERASAANDEAAKLRNQAAELKKEAAAQRKDTEAENLARVQLQTAIAPRVLTRRELQQITDDCRPFASSDVQILVRGRMGAGRVVAVQIMNALEAAGVCRLFRPLPWYELGISLLQDEHWQIGVSVSSAVAKAAKFPIMGFTQVLPAGSPITLTIGDKSIGKLPPLKPPHQ